MLIRGRSTLFANARPLIVFNQFPYEGDLHNIHPQDIASVTILKDAAAASIWGARAANGVIVLSSRTGSGNRQRPAFAFSSYLGIQARPELDHVPAMTTTDFIGLEQQLFHSGYYDRQEKSVPYGQGHYPFTPVVETLIAERDGRISPAEAASRIETFKQQDLRQDIARYLYQTAIRQQYTLSHTGRTHYVSAGHDRHTGSLTGQHGWRNTLRAHRQVQFRRRLQLRVGINASTRLEQHGRNDGTASHTLTEQDVYPYARLADDQGNPLPVYLFHRQSFTDAASANGLLDWQYRPLESIHDETLFHRTDHWLGTVSTSYRIHSHWEAAVHYQHERQLTRITDHYAAGSYYVRHLVNEFTQTDKAGEVAFRPIPVGDIEDQQRGTLHARQARAIMHYNRRWEHHQLSAQAGAEIRYISQHQTSERRYDNPSGDAIANLDTATAYPLYSRRGTQQRISHPHFQLQLADRFRSVFLLADYRYRDQLLLSGSIRADRAGLYGPQASQSGAPFWSIGAGWIRPHVQLRASYGIQGNISRQAYAGTTDHVYPETSGGTNELLSWERSRTFNIGIQVSPSPRLSVKGAVYRRQAANLLGETGEGKSEIFSNNSGLRTAGADLSIHTGIIQTDNFQWQATGNFAFSNTVVSKYRHTHSALGRHYLIVSGRQLQPVAGKPVFSLYSFPWSGLHPDTGDPIGVINGTPSQDWISIYERTPLAAMQFHGSAVPTYWGSLRQHFRYKNIHLSILLSSQLGYYFRRSALSYTTLLVTWSGHSEYTRRWQQPGDENHTNVPALKLRPDADRDNFYRLASIQVLKGDHIRLEDIKLHYHLTGKQLPVKSIKSVELYACLENMPVLWKANLAGIDPYYSKMPAAGSRCTLGITANF